MSAGQWYFLALWACLFAVAVVMPAFDRGDR